MTFCLLFSVILEKECLLAKIDCFKSNLAESEGQSRKRGTFYLFNATLSSVYVVKLLLYFLVSTHY